VLLPPPPKAATDTVLTTAPLALVNAFASALVIQNTLSRLISNILSQKSSVNALRSAGGIGVRVPIEVEAEQLRERYPDGLYERTLLTARVRDAELR
jgi:hypothetical protein